MDYLELSLDDVELYSMQLANKIEKSYKPDIIIFIAKGAYKIGKGLSEYFEVPLLEITATRKASRIKKIASPFLKITPKRIKMYLRRKEMKLGYHERNNERTISCDNTAWEPYNDVKNVLIVDDSVDTGNTIIIAKEAAKKVFMKADIKIAALNYFDKCINNAKPEFFIWSNTMLNGPWSNDSKENIEFIKEYEIAKKEKYFL